MILSAMPNVSASSRYLPDLKSAEMSFDDPLMNAEDLAFDLATHGFDATPKGVYVEFNLGSNIFRLNPNGSAPELCFIAS